MKPMRILLTGATGYLGSQLAEALLGVGHEVVVLKRSTSSLKRIAHLFRLTVLDIEQGIEKIFEHQRFDTVLHTATSYGRKSETIEQISEANLCWPLKLLMQAIVTDTPLLINTDTALNRMLNPYALSKAQFAEWGRLVAKQYPLRFINLKIEHFYGPGDDESKFTTHVIKACLRNDPRLPLTPGEQRRDFVHIDDVVAAYLLLLEHATFLPQGFNEFEVCSGVPITIRQFVELVHTLTGSSTHLEFGAIPYRDEEVMESKTNPAHLVQIGWSCQWTLEDGLRQVIEQEIRA